MARVPDRLGGLTRTVRRDAALLAVAFGLPMALLTLQRAVVHAAWGPECETGPLAFAFLHGLRFDAAGVAYPFVLALGVATIATVYGVHRLERAALTAVTAWIAIVAAAELPFFAEFPRASRRHSAGVSGRSGDGVRHRDGRTPDRRACSVGSVRCSPRCSPGG